MFVCTGHIIVYIIRTARNGHGEIMRPGSPQHGSEPVICRFAGHWVDVPRHILAVLPVIIVDTFIEHLDEKVSGSKFKPVCPRLVTHAYACIYGNRRSALAAGLRRDDNDAVGGTGTVDGS